MLLGILIILSLMLVMKLIKFKLVYDICKMLEQKIDQVIVNVEVKEVKDERG